MEGNSTITASNDSCNVSAYLNINVYKHAATLYRKLHTSTHLTLSLILMMLNYPKSLIPSLSQIKCYSFHSASMGILNRCMIYLHNFSTVGNLMVCDHDPCTYLNCYESRYHLYSFPSSSSVCKGQSS